MNILKELRCQISIMLLNLSKLKMNVFTNSSESNKKIQYLFVLVFAVFAPGHFYHFSCQDIFNIRQYYLLTLLALKCALNKGHICIILTAAVYPFYSLNILNLELTSNNARAHFKVSQNSEVCHMSIPPSSKLCKC